MKQTQTTNPTNHKPNKSNKSNKPNESNKHQIHVTDGGATVRLYSRNAEDQTPKFPDVVQRLKSWLAPGTDSVVIDGEVRRMSF